MSDQDGASGGRARQVVGAAARGVVLAKSGGVVLFVGAVITGILAVLLACAIVGATMQTSTVPWPVTVATQATDSSYRASGWAVSSRFGWRTDPVTGEPAFHEGIDLTGPSFCAGCVVPSVLDGQVTYLGFDPLSTMLNDGGGQMVIVQNGGGEFETTYAHLEPYRLYVRLEGRIDDSYGRFPAFDSYQAIGTDPLTPGVGSSAIQIGCVGNNPPQFRLDGGDAASGFAFVFDRPAQGCSVSVMWGKKGRGWRGWVPDGATSLPLETTIADGRAFDTGVRFRAHLVPPPPEPITPTVTLTPVAASALDTARVAASNQTCTPQRGSVCRWELPQPVRPNERTRLAQGVGGPHRAPMAQTSGFPKLDIDVQTSEVAAGGMARILVRVTATDAPWQGLVTLYGLDAAVVTLERDDCQSDPVVCPVAVAAGEMASFAVAWQVPWRDPPASYAVVATLPANGSTLFSQTGRVRVLGVQGTPTALPTATLQPPASGGPDPAATLPPTAPCWRAAVAALTKQGSVYSQGGALPEDPRDAQGQPLPRTGPHSFDCSGLVWWAYAQAGISIGTSTYTQINDGVAIPCTLADLAGAASRCWAAGDLIFLRAQHGGGDVGGGSDQHVAIYTGNGLFMDCYNHRVGCVLHAVEHDPYYRAHFWQARRITDGCGDVTLDPGVPQPALPPLGDPPQADSRDVCTPQRPSLRSAVTSAPGCGPPLRRGDLVYQLVTPLGFVGMTGATTGPHLHLGLRMRDVDGSWQSTDICRPPWLVTARVPPETNCFTTFVDPLDFLPRAAASDASAGTPIPEGAPYQLPPPGFRDSLVVPTLAATVAVGSYWNPYMEPNTFYGGGWSSGGGQSGGGW